VGWGGSQRSIAASAASRPRTRSRRGGRPPPPPPTLLLRYAELIEALRGTYVTAADMNTGQDDMDTIAEATSFVLGRSPERGGAGDPAIGTALGAFHAIVAACGHAFGSTDLTGRTVLVQGCGAVGDRLAGHLAEAGATLVLADVDAARAAATATRVGGRAIETDAVVGTPCDVFSPCATGAVLSAATIPALACRVVAGAANNQLAESADAERLRAAEIVYAPDYVVNAGGVIWLAGYETLGWDDATMRARLAGIGATLERVFADAEREGITTAEAADRLALARIQAGPDA
jgi:leucine dehydrogenase